MIRSMTGFGRASGFTETSKSGTSYNVTVEIKSVNHRYFEFFSKTPRAYGFLDQKLKSYISTKVARGKIECYVSIESVSNDDCVVSVNHSLVSGLLGAYKELEETYGLSNDVTVASISRNSDVFSISRADADEEEVWNAVKPVLDSAVENFVSMREVEGEKLRADVLSRLETILEMVSFIEKRSPQSVSEYREKLFAKMKSVLEDSSIDETRILLEAGIFADKVAVDEETVRLRSHVARMKEFMNSEVAIGKKADFLVREFNREANTIGSKCRDVEISKKVIDIKSEIEKIRERIQNIE